MLRSVFLKTLRDRRRGLAWWVAGVVLLTVWVVAFYPSIRESASEYSRILEQMPEGLRNLFFAEGVDLGSPQGYLSVEVFSFVAPILFLVYGIGFGARTIAGEEQEGSLDLLLSNPIPRRRVLGQKLAAMLVALVVLGLALWATLAIGSTAAGMDISLANLGSGVASAVLLGWAFGGLALAVGAATGRRAIAVGAASAVAVASYLLNGLAQSVPELGPYRVLSPFYWYLGADPISNGLDLAHAGLLLTVLAAAAAAAAVLFDRRDLAAA